MAASTTPPSDPTPGAAPANPPTAPMAPGDEAPEGTPATGETICPQCGGTGSMDGAPCSYCRGSGKINVGIGGA